MPIIRFESRDNNSRNDARKIEVSDTKKVVDEKREAMENSDIVIELDGSYTLSTKPTYCKPIEIYNIGYRTLVKSSDGNDSPRPLIPADPRNLNLPKGLEFSFKWFTGYIAYKDYPGTEIWHEHSTGPWSPTFARTDAPTGNALEWYDMSQYFPDTPPLPGFPARKAHLGVQIVIRDRRTQVVVSQPKFLDLGRIKDPGFSIDTCYITVTDQPAMGEPTNLPYSVIEPYFPPASSAERGSVLIARSNHWPRKRIAPVPLSDFSVEYVWYKKSSGSEEYVPIGESNNYYPYIAPFAVGDPELDGEGVNQALYMPETEYNDEDVFMVEAVLTHEQEGFRRTARSDDTSSLTDDTVVGVGYKNKANWISGYYPLYERMKDADKASPNNSSHIHTLKGKKFYMPDGVPYVHNYTMTGDGIMPGEYNENVQRQQEIADLNRQEDLQENPRTEDPVEVAPVEVSAPTRSSSSSSSGSGGY